MALQDFEQSLQDLSALIELVRIGTIDSKKLRSIGVDVALIPAATSGVIVLVVGRFEEFLKEEAERALAQYSKANPPVSRSQLSLELQLAIVRANLTGATRELVHGQRRPVSDRIRDLQAIASRVVNDEIWGNDAIDTASNPGPETVKSILKLLGLENPWDKIEANFIPNWISRQGKTPGLKAIPSAKAELESVLGWRNTVAHSRSTLPIGPSELDTCIAFLRELAKSIDEVVRDITDQIVMAASSIPGNWPP
jgi:hypothetical protein